MRHTLLTPALFLAAVALPATSRAELIVNSSWEQAAAISGAIAATFNFQNQTEGMLLRTSQFDVRNPPAQFAAIWFLNSVKIDGITVLNPQYTPNAADFELIIKTGLGAVAGTASASAVGSLVSNGDGTSRFDITFTTITGQPTFGPFTGYADGSYLLNLKLASSSTLSTNEVLARGFLPTQSYDWYGMQSQGFVGAVPTVQWIGPSPLVIDATNVLAPIPEPSTYGLMLGGLALVGAAIRRRRKA